MATFILSAVLDIGGLVLIWFLLRARITKTLEIDGILAEARKEARLLTIEINETTDRNISLVEDRLNTLRELLAEADRRMGVFRRETGRRQAETEVYSRLGRRQPLRDGLSRLDEEVLAEPRPSASDVETEAESRTQTNAKLETAEPVPLSLGPKAPEIVVAPLSVIPPRSLRERAIELHKNGFSADIIAARLGATISEIDLLVSLEEGRAGPGGMA